MTRTELDTKIETGGGEWIAASGMKFTNEGQGNTIHVAWEAPGGYVFQAFLMAHEGDNMAGFYINSAGDLKDVAELVQFLTLLNNNTEAGVVIPQSVTVEKPITDAHTAGKVEAYERLLIGRALTISA